MPLYAETEQQRQRKQFIHNTVLEEQQREEMLSNSQPVEELIDEAQMQQDAVSLGKKKTFKPNDEQRRRNERIDTVRKATGLKKATADTLEMHDTLQKVRENDEEESPPELKMQLLLSTKFSPQMLISSNIRAHFAEYMQLVYAYEYVKDMRDKRVDLFRENMELLTERMRVFCSQNRLHTDGSYMSDKEKAETFHIDRKRILKQDLLGQPSPEEYEAPKVNAFSIQSFNELAMTNESIKGPSQYRFGNDQYVKIKRIGRFYANKNAQDRVNNIWVMRSDLDAINEDITALCTQEDVTKPEVMERLVQLRRELIEVTACLNLAEAEMRVVRSADLSTEEREHLVEAAKTAYTEYTCILRRFTKERTAIAAAFSGPGLMDRSKALSGESDKQNFDFKKGILEEAERIDVPELEEVKNLAIEYAEASHYTVGNDEESMLLHRLLDAIKKQKDDGHGTELEALSQKLSLLNTSSLPDWDEIPEGLKMEYCGHELEETGSIHDKGAVRNWFLTTKVAKVWEDRKEEPLFSHEPTINDLRQGKISNCYMLAAVTKLIQLDPQAIKNVIKDNGDGTATVRLYNGEIPMFIHVDKKTVHLRSGGAIASDGPLWMQLIEMAAAHVGRFQEGRSGLGSLWYGRGDEFFAMLTGVPVTGILKSTDADGTDSFSGGVEGPDELFERIRTADENGEVFHMGTKGSTSSGMNSGHAYTVLGAKEVDGKKYVTLRNPYANMSYRTDAYGDEEMSSTYLSSVADQTCGQFDMPLEDFIRNAQSVSYSRLTGPLFPGGTTAEDLEAYVAEIREHAREIEEQVLDMDSVDLSEDQEQHEKEDETGIISGAEEEKETEKTGKEGE